MAYNTKDTTALSRGYKYGDGIFETFRIYKGEILLWSYHKMRLMHSLGYLRLEQPSFFSLEKLYEEIIEESAKIGTENVRVRVTFIRKAGGFYTPDNNEFEYTIEASALASAPFPFYESGLNIGLSTKVRLNYGDDFSNCKTISALPYVLAAIEAKEEGWDDALILNSAGRVCEGTKANVWLVFYPDNQNFRKTQKNNRITIVTPPLHEGCVRGVVRSFLIQLLKESQFNIEEYAIESHDIEQAKELWFTNAMIGIQYISSIKVGNDTYNYKSVLAKRVQHLLSQKVSSEE